MLQISCSKLGLHRGGRRLWLEGLRLQAAGYLPGVSYAVTAALGRVTLQIQETGERVVSGKTRGRSVYPVIDIDRIERLLGECERAQVTIDVGVIVIVVHPHDRAVIERRRRLLHRLCCGEPLAFGSLSHGGGILDRALHRGFEDTGVPVTLAWACERESVYLQAAIERNPVWSAETLVLHAEMEDVDTALLPRIDVLAAGLPCTGASMAGRAKNGLRHAEEHETAGTPFLAFLDVIRRCQPALVLLENVTAYADTASMAVIRAALARWGYDLHEHVVGAALAGTLEQRDRLCLIAVTHGLDFEWAPQPVRARETCLGEVLEPIGPDDPAWRRCSYLDDKEVRDQLAGKGFRLQRVTPASTALGTIGRGYAKWRSTEPMLAHPSGDGRRRLLTPREHAAVKGVPAELVAGLPATLAHELLGQSVLYPVWRAVARMLGQHCRQWQQQFQHAARQMA